MGAFYIPHGRHSCAPEPGCACVPQLGYWHWTPTLRTHQSCAAKAAASADGGSARRPQPRARAARAHTASGQSAAGGPAMPAATACLRGQRHSGIRIDAKSDAPRGRLSGSCMPGADNQIVCVPSLDILGMLSL